MDWPNALERPNCLGSDLNQTTGQAHVSRRIAQSSSNSLVSLSVQTKDSASCSCNPLCRSTMRKDRQQVTLRFDFSRSVRPASFRPNVGGFSSVIPEQKRRRGLDVSDIAWDFSRAPTFSWRRGSMQTLPWSRGRRLFGGVY